MSIDVYFQPVDTAMWNERLFPYIHGKGDIEDLFAQAKALRQVGAVVSAATRPVFPFEDDHSYPDWYDHELTRSFRPFFVVQNEPDVVARLVEAYHTGGPKVAVDVVRQQVRLIALDRADQVTMPAVGKGEADLTRHRQRLDELRDGFATLVREGDDEDVSPAFCAACDLYNCLVYRYLLRFNEELQPRWWLRAWFMGFLFPHFRIPDWEELCEPAQRLFDPLFAPLPDAVFDCLNEPRDLGWCVSRENVPALRERIAERVAQIGIDLTTDSDNQQRALLCLLEALTYAERRGFALTERID